ncbi:MAG: hypothetical protein K6B74_01830 [Ruminococcus sp.]|nr:hypothetical protein [Ruminococcus sp.]
MKKTRLNAIAAAALMTVFMLSGCGKDVGTAGNTENANNNVTAATESSAPVPDAAGSQKELQSADGNRIHNKKAYT